jgi:hypothetical protein
MYDVTAPGRELHRKFVELGNMIGQTSEEIIAVVGPPTSISAMAKGHTLLQWQATGCHMALLFGPDSKCITITHQYANYQEEPSGVGTAIGVVIGILVAVAIIASHC